ncbi:MAG: LamG domain-containing protein, partial [Candidatus Binatia bacterium]
SLIQAAAILAALEANGSTDEQELAVLLAQLLEEADVRAGSIGQTAIYATRENGDSCEDCRATCSGTCVQGPRGDCFCYERLPTDPERIAILLLEEPEDEMAALEADRVPCLPSLFPAGVKDGFSAANGAEPAAASQGLLAFIQLASGQPAAAFDGTAVDRLFGNTFTLPQGRCLREAKVLVRARPLSSNPSPGSRNDVVRLAFANPSGQLAAAQWAAFFGTGNNGLPILLAQQWRPTIYPAPAGASFILNAVNLPGGVNLLPDIDAARFVDLLVQDDTSIDYASLVARICDCPTPTPTPSGTRTHTPISTRPPTATRTSTRTATATATPPPPLTATSTRTSTAAATATHTGTPTATGTPTRTPMCTAPPPNMVGWWPMDDGTGATALLDIVGGRHAMTQASPVGAAQAPQPVAGVVGGAIDFPKFGNGFSGASANSSGALFAVGSADFSIDAWVRFPPAGANQRHYVVNKFDASGNVGYGLFVLSPGANNYRPVFEWGDGTNGGTVQTASAIAPNQWHHIAVTFARNAGGNALDIRLYVNGAQDGQHIANPASLGSLTNFLISLEIGQQPSTVGPIALDELELFDRALSAQEIQDLFDAGSGGKCKPPTPTATASATRTITITGTATATSTRTGTATRTRTPTASPAPPSSTATASATPTTTPTCIDPPSDMVAWWTADNTTSDLSGNGNHGALHGAASYTTGAVGAAFSLPTIADYVEVPDAPALDFSGNFSIDAWINTLNIPNGRATIVDKRAGTNTNPVGY